jgi:sorting nexin-9/18/33
MYDFDGNESNGELSLVTGETIIILRQDIGDGWWEAMKPSGMCGLIPETYVEIVSAPEPQFPPPPPPEFGVTPSAPPMSSSNGYAGSPPDSGGNNLNHQQSVDDWDDEWDDDDGESSTSTGGHSQDLGDKSSTTTQIKKQEGKRTPHGNEMSKYGTVKSSFNRFSNFAKSGGEAFIMGQTNDKASDSDKIKIIDTVDGPVWMKQDNGYTCILSDPKKESKMKGLKSFMSYQLTPSFSNIQVSRRYKHFDWLHERLELKFPCIPIPPLPDKAVTGRYEEDFVQERMRQLQSWINRMVRHPVMSRSDVFHHFLTCTDEKKWKVGKRRAEKDKFQGGKFFLLLQTPSQSLPRRELESKMEVFFKFVTGMTDNMKTLVTVNHEYSKKQIGPFKREYGKIGTSYKQLAHTFSLDKGAYSLGLTAALKDTGDAYIEIGEMFAKQPVQDAYPLIESLHEYKGILQTYPEALKVHEGAVGKAKECQKLLDEGKMNAEDTSGVMARTDIISYATVAEMNHFQQERARDFKYMMQKYLQEQISFYKRLTGKLEEALQHYNNA